MSMRIIPSHAVEMSDADRMRGEPAYLTEDSIEIPDARWQLLWVGYNDYTKHAIHIMSFAQYIRKWITEEINDRK